MPAWGKSVVGDFEPLVPGSLFDRVQGILAGRVLTTVPHPFATTRASLFAEHCSAPECRLRVTASSSSGKSGKNIRSTTALEDEDIFGSGLRRSRQASLSYS